MTEYRALSHTNSWKYCFLIFIIYLLYYYFNFFLCSWNLFFCLILCVDAFWGLFWKLTISFIYGSSLWFFFNIYISLLIFSSIFCTFSLNMLFYSVWKLSWEKSWIDFLKSCIYLSEHSMFINSLKSCLLDFWVPF